MGKTIVQEGGALDIAAMNIQSTIAKIDDPWRLTVGFLIVFIIAYAEQLSAILSTTSHISLRSLGGRLIGIVLILYLLNYVGWIYGLLGTIAFLLIMREDDTVEEKANDVTTEQFSDLVVKARQGNKWFIERVLGEEPSFIEEDRVETTAIQG
jgi:hypothetical protein